MTGAKIPWVTDLPETAALYAVCNRHYGEAQRIVRHDMTTEERIRFVAHLEQLHAIAIGIRTPDTP